MLYDRYSIDGFKAWLSSRMALTGWNMDSVAEGLTDDIILKVIHQYDEFDKRMVQGILLASLYMNESDLRLIQNNLNKLLQIASNDSNSSLRVMANIIKGYPSSRHIEYHIDQYHPDCRQLVQNIISTVKQKGLDFHPLEDRILDADSHKVPSYATANYKRYTPTSVNHFTLTKNKEDLISDEDRWARFNSIVQEEERAEQAVDQTKRSSVDFSRKPSIDMTNNTRTFNQPVKEPMMRPALGRFPSDSNRPPPRAPSNLFIAKPKAKVGVKSIQRSTSNPRPSFSNNLPPGLQRNQKTQMLDFDAATQIEQQNANEKKRVNDEIKAKQDAKKAELLMKRKKAQEEKERKRRKVEETRSPSSTKSPSPSSPISASHLPSSPVSPHMKDFDAPMIVHPPMRASSERNATF